jgi:ATP/maltotriose-dependent transcriptional regulator MalT
VVTGKEPVADGFAALAEGRWEQARSGFEAIAARGEAETAEACFGLAMALWWLGENHACVDRYSRAYALFRASGDAEGAARCAVWLAITYKSNFANFAAANGWVERAERLLEPLEPGPLHGWVRLARAYRMADLDEAEELTGWAVQIAQAARDVDLELAALAQLGLIRVGKGQTDAGFALIDEAMAAALAGEPQAFDTVVFACCDMLSACELVSDIERAAQWCKVADDFVARYGCPFLYAECRIYYGSLLTAKGRWDDAERELKTGARITEGACPGLHSRALARLAALRLRQGRLEEAEELLAGMGGDIEAEAEASVLAAAVSLARGDAPAAARRLEQRLRHLQDHRSHLGGALDVLVDAYIHAGRIDDAAGAAARLTATADAASSRQLAALAASARGRVALARGDDAAVTDLEAALELWSSLELPLEAARTRFELARALAATEPEAAVDHARRALAELEGLSAARDADRAAAFLRSVGVVPRTGPKGTGTLTMREREVLALVGAGLSNPEIAERLHISRKTASHHVSSILAKLGLRSRAEAAAHAARRAGAPDAPQVPRT